MTPFPSSNPSPSLLPSPSSPSPHSTPFFLHPSLSFQVYMEEFFFELHVSSLCTNHFCPCSFPEIPGHCSIAVSAEADVRLFLRRDDEDQQLLGKCDFLCIFLYVVCNPPSLPFPLHPYLSTPTLSLFRCSWMNLVLIII